MDEAEAKRHARFHAAMCLDNALSNGWESLDERYGEVDAAKVREAIHELVIELAAVAASKE